MDDAELSEERDRPTPRERLEDMADCYEQMAEEDRGSPEECRANAAAIRAVLSRVKDLECSAGCVPMAEYDESRAREAKTLERYAVACQTIHDIEVREARLREAAEPLLDLCENRDGSGYSPWREAISGLRAALASGETVKTVPVPPEVFERSTAEEMRALASGESRAIEWRDWPYLSHAIECCDAWEPGARLIGNVPAKELGDMLRALRALGEER